MGSKTLLPKGNRLLIRKHHEDIGCPFSWVGFYYDEKTQIRVREIQINTEKPLEVGKIYDFTYYDAASTYDTYTYAVCGKTDSSYCLIQFEDVLEKCPANQLSDIWEVCDFKEKYGVDLKNFTINKTPKPKTCKLCNGGFDFRKVQIAEMLGVTGISFTPNLKSLPDENRFRFCPSCGRELSVKADFC